MRAAATKRLHKRRHGCFQLTASAAELFANRDLATHHQQHNAGTAVAVRLLLLASVIERQGIS
jgi:hypothetical protein